VRVTGLVSHFDRDRSRRAGAVIVISQDGFNQTPGWRSIIVVPISTSTAQSRRGPTVIELPGGTAGLSKASFAVRHQVEVEEGLKLAMDLD